MLSSSCGIGQTARLEMQCLLLARSSTIDSVGTVTWSGVDGDLIMPKKQFVREARIDKSRLVRMVDASAKEHLKKKDVKGDNDVAVTALRFVANQLDKGYTPEKRQRFGLQHDVMKKIAQVLRSIANDVDNDDNEFPWVRCGTIDYGFIDKEVWRQQSAELNSALENVETLEDRVQGIYTGLEAVGSHWGCKTNTGSIRGTAIAPQTVTNAKTGCRHQKTHQFSLAVLLEGLVCDPVFDNGNFCEFVHENYDKDPTELSMRKQMEALLLFLRKVKVIPNWYTPSFLQLFDGDFNASDAEVDRMKEIFNELIGSKENRERLHRERQQMDIMVRLNTCHCFYIHFLATTLTS